MSTGLYYLDAVTGKGSDSNDGLSTSTPWATLAHADATLSTNYPNVRVMYPDGVYRDIAPVWHSFLSYYVCVLNVLVPSILYDIYNGHHASLVVGADTVRWVSDASLVFDNVGSSAQVTTSPTWPTYGPTTGGAFIVVQNQTGLSGLSSNCISFGCNGGSGAISLINPRFSDNNVYWQFGSVATGRINFATTFNSTTNQIMVWGCLAGGSRQALYQNDVLKVSQAVNDTFTYGTGSGAFGIGYGLVSSPFLGNIYSLMICGTTLADADYVTLCHWQQQVELNRRPVNHLTLDLVTPKTVAATPPMGLDTWRSFQTTCNVNQAKTQALNLSRTILPSLGYTLFNASDCIFAGGSRDGNGNLVPNANWPADLTSYFSYITGLGLKIAIYLGPGGPFGGIACNTYIGSTGFESQDINHLLALAGNNIGYLMYDSCTDFGSSLMTSLNYQAMGLAIQKSGQPIIFLVSCPVFNDDAVYGGGSNSWFRQVGGNLFCSNTDQGNPMTWTKFLAIADFHATVSGPTGTAPYVSGPGSICWPDFLGVGNGTLTVSEGRCMFSIYCLMPAALWIGTDPASLSAADLATLANPELIAINQDPLVIGGTRVSHVMGTTDFMDVWARRLLNGKWAVALLNRDSVSNVITVNWGMFGQGSNSFSVRDTINHVSLGLFGSGYSTTVASHDVSVLVLTPGTGFPDPQMKLADAWSYTIQTSAGITGGTASFQELCTDGVVRPLADPAPIILASSTTYTGSFPGQYPAVQILIQGLTGGTILFSEVKQTFRQTG